MVREQEALRGGSPLSVAVTVREYSARSEWLRGDDERSSPVIAFKEKRSALGPLGDRKGQTLTGDEMRWRVANKYKMLKLRHFQTCKINVTNYNDRGVLYLTLFTRRRQIALYFCIDLLINATTWPVT